MRNNDLPERLSTFLSVFGPKGKDSKHYEKVEGMAEFLGNQPRTIEAYLSYREDRTIGPDDYWRVAVEWVRRRANMTTGLPSYIVTDENGAQLYECRHRWQAVFLADVDGHGIEKVRGHSIPDRPDELEQRRSRLRWLVRDGVITEDQICQVFGFRTRHSLVDYRMEHVYWISTPDDFRLRVLENFAVAQIGEAA